jgi:archaemetzincin
MRLVLAVGWLAAALAAAKTGDDPNAPLRPSPRVLTDPPAWYSPLLFTPKAAARPGEWMAEHPEPEQSFQQYVAAQPIRPTRARHTIILAPLGPMGAAEQARLEALREFLALYYTLPVRIGPALGLDGVTSRDRSMFGRTVRQYLTDDILHQVLKPAVPDDALCLLGVTMEDLYPEPSWNYVFGQASLGLRVGVYSLVRFYPAFWGLPDTEEARRKGLARSLHTLVHETGHMLGVHHCQKFDCVMNGTNSLQESDSRPIHLCPECLRMLRWDIGFDLVERYEGLRKYYEGHGMKDEAAWVARRLRQCRGEKVTPDDAAKRPD